MGPWGHTAWEAAVTTEPFEKGLGQALRSIDVWGLSMKRGLEEVEEEDTGRSGSISGAVSVKS